LLQILFSHPNSIRFVSRNFDDILKINFHGTRLLSTKFW